MTMLPSFPAIYRSGPGLKLGKKKPRTCVQGRGLLKPRTETLGHQCLQAAVIVHLPTIVPRMELMPRAAAVRPGTHSSLWVKWQD